MDLTSDYFCELLGALPDADNPSLDEARKDVRVAVNAQASVIALALCDSMPATVSVRDLSRTGMGIVTSQGLALDQQFVLLLSQKEDPPALVLCSVAFRQPLSRQLFAIGARFVAILRNSADGLPIHLQPAPQPTAIDSAIRRSA